MRLLMLVCTFSLLAASVSAVPSSLNVNGEIKNGSRVLNETVTVRLSIYNNSGGIAGFNQSSQVIVSNGFFSSYLYGLDPLWFYRNNITSIGISVGDDGEATPRMNLSSVAYAFVSDYVLNPDVSLRNFSIIRDFGANCGSAAVAKFNISTNNFTCISAGGGVDTTNTTIYGDVTIFGGLNATRYVLATQYFVNQSPTIKTVLTSSIINTNISINSFIVSGKNKNFYNTTYWCKNGNCPIMCMPFDVNNGTTTTDVCGTMGAVVNGSTAYNSTGGTRGSGAYTFNGTLGGGITVPFSPSMPNMTLLDPITINFWMIPNDVTVFRTMVAHGQVAPGANTNSNWFVYMLGAGSVRFSLANGSGGLVAVAGGNIHPGEEVMVSATFNGSHTALYLNGTSMGSATSSNPVRNGYSSNISIGWDSYRSTDARFPFNGTIDKVQIWNRSLSAAEISALYQSDVLPSSAVSAGEVWSATTYVSDGMDYSNAAVISINTNNATYIQTNLTGSTSAFACISKEGILFRSSTPCQ